MADLENETLRRLKFKQNRHWDELSIQKLLSIYVDAAKRELPLSTQAEIQRVKKVEELKKRMSQPDSVAHPDNTTFTH